MHDANTDLVCPGSQNEECVAAEAVRLPFGSLPADRAASLVHQNQVGVGSTKPCMIKKIDFGTGVSKRKYRYVEFLIKFKIQYNTVQ